MVTLERDVERMLRAEMQRSRKSFKQTLNAAVRAGLKRKANRKTGRFVVRARPMNLRAEIDPAGFNKLADGIEVDSAVLES